MTHISSVVAKALAKHAVILSTVLAFGVLLSACPKRQTTGDGDKPAQSTRKVEKGYKLATLPSGANMKVPLDWKVSKKDDGLTITGPEGKLVVELVEISGAKDMKEAMATAISRRWPDFKREGLATETEPGRKGFDASRWASFKTSPEENQAVWAGVNQKGELYIVTLLDVPMSHYQRRQSQMAVIGDSLWAAGYTKETYQGRKPLRLDEAKLAQLRDFIARAMKTADLPGLAVVLFDKDGTVMEEGFGVRELGKPEPVTPDSLFLIASNTKPLVTLLLAKLADEGKFTWDTPVTQVYPDFRLGDEETTKKVLMKHLVCACTGLPRQDFEWLFTHQNSSPEKALKLLGTMQPTTGFGELFQYSNPLASAAGFIGGHLVYPDQKLGQAFDKAMAKKVFEPLGMTGATFDFDQVLKKNHAKPHCFDMQLKNVPSNFDLNRTILPIRPAGGAWVSAKDYAKYVRMDLAQGLLPDGSRYIGEQALMSRRLPQVRMDNKRTYAMGLILKEVKDIPIIIHGGSMIGMKSNFFFVPSTGLGGVVFTNSDSGYWVLKALTKRVLELTYDGHAEAEEDLEAGIKGFRKYWAGEFKDWQVPPDPTQASRLAAAYHHPIMGEIKVQQEGQKVIFILSGWQSEMATKKNPDGSTSFLTTLPGFDGLDFAAPKGDEPIKTLTLRDAQHTYAFEEVLDTK